MGTSGGCAIFIRNNIGISDVSIVISEAGRLLIIDFLFSGHPWRVICVYAPNNATERVAFFERIESYLQCTKRIVMIGDFNCVLMAEDRAKVVLCRDKSAKVLDALIQENDLEDLGWLLSNGNRPVFTHFQRGSSARLDRVCATVDFVSMCTKYEVKHVSFSDHSLVMVTIGGKRKKTQFNWQLWKFNVKLLGDEIFNEKVKKK